MNTSVIQKIKTSPKDPGVYIFRGKSEVLYVGKAANLRNRLKSYLPKGDASARGGPASGWKTQSLHQEATKLEYIPLRSEIEALIEESRLIKELKPKYNILWRDDKSYLYVAITRDSMPKVFITHKSLNPKRYTLNPTLIGPFTDGAALRLVMKLLRRHFPYCTCLQPHLRDCLNAQIGKCLGFCCKKISPSVIAIPQKREKQSYKNLGKIATAPKAPRDDEKKYAHNIKMIKTILRGQSKKLLDALTDTKERVALEKIFEHRDFIHQRKTNQERITEFVYSKKISFSLMETLNKVECYDISNFAGKEAVGAMTALVKKDGVWVSDKNSYRKFKIKSAPTRDDPRMIYEVVSRRLRHPEWAYPDLIIIDGGITQYRAALKAQSENPNAAKIKITAYPKPQKTLLGWPNTPKEILELAERAIYQTHNFVIRYHRKVRNKALFDITR